jgi:acyl carrier protein phosphodiesterase
MNFLSHLFLSGNAEHLIIGNFIADSVKGNAFNNYPAEIQKGILLHRKIDTFTDTHHIVELSKQRLREKYKKYASVIVDVYYDHYLAANWADYSQENLGQYTQKIYSLIEQNNHHLPQKSVLFNNYMVKYDILVAYSRLQGIERVLKGMAYRTTFVSNMEYAINDLKEHYHLFENEFKLFFPELQKFVNKEIETL